MDVLGMTGFSGMTGISGIGSIYDADGAAWDARIAAFTGADPARKTAKMQFVANCKDDGVWGKFTMGSLGEGNASANAVCCDRVATGTFVNSPTHNPSSVTFGAGHLLTPISPAFEGGSEGLFLYNEARVNAGTVSDIGACDAAFAGLVAINNVQTGNTSAVYYRGLTPTISGFEQLTAALYFAQRLSSTTQLFDRTTSSGSTTISSAAISAPTGLCGTLISVSGFNNNGTVTSISGHTCRLWGHVNTVLTAPQLAALKINIISYMIDRGWIT